MIDRPCHSRVTQDSNREVSVSLCAEELERPSFLQIVGCERQGMHPLHYLSMMGYQADENGLQELTPLIYTPTVGEACQRWSELYTQPEGT